MEEVDISNFGDTDLLTFDDIKTSPTTPEWISPNTSFGSTAVSGSSLIDSPAGTPLTPFTPGDYELKRTSPRDNTKAIGLGVCNIQPKDQSVVIPSRYRNTAHGSVDVHDTQDFHEHDYLTLSDEPEPDLPFEEPGQWRAINSPPPSEPELIFSCRFLDVEHNRLAGAASFIEDMDEEEREDHWEMLAREKGRHSAREWEVYYEQVVKPAYLAKLAEKEDSVAVVEGAESEEEVDSHEEDAQVGQGLAASKCAPKVKDETACQMNGSNHYDAAKVSSVDNPLEEECGLHHTERGNDVQASHPGAAALVDRPDGLLLSAPANSIGKIQALGRITLSASSSTLREQGPVDTSLPNAIQLRREAQPCSPTTDSDPDRRPSHAAPRTTPPHRRSPLLSHYPLEASDIIHNIHSTDLSSRHTVLISNIPVGITLAQILSKVRGGKIVSATFLETCTMKTLPAMEGNAAMIIFLGAQEAQKYMRFCAENELSFFSSCGSASATPAQASLIPTPTYLLSRELLDKLHNCGLTRVLFIIDSKHAWTPEGVVQEMVRYSSRLRRPLNTGRDADAVLFFEFADVRDADMAWEVVDYDYTFFQGASKGFLLDRCARPLDPVKEEDSYANDNTVVDTPTSSLKTSGGEESTKNLVIETPVSSFMTNGSEHSVTTTVMETPMSSFATGVDEDSVEAEDAQDSKTG